VRSSYAAPPGRLTMNTLMQDVRVALRVLQVSRFHHRRRTDAGLGPSPRNRIPGGRRLFRTLVLISATSSAQ
jgi:hypothetical protein